MDTPPPRQSAQRWCTRQVRRPLSTHPRHSHAFDDVRKADVFPQVSVRKVLNKSPANRAFVNLFNNPVGKAETYSDLPCRHHSDFNLPVVGWWAGCNGAKGPCAISRRPAVNSSALSQVVQLSHLVLSFGVWFVAFSNQA